MTIQKAMPGLGVDPKDLEPLFHQAIARVEEQVSEAVYIIEAEYKEIPKLPEVPQFTPAEDQRVEEAKANFKAEKTRKNYDNGMAQFTNWCQTKGVQPLPAHPKTVGVYLSHRYDLGLSIGTVKLDCVSIGHAHRQAELPDPTKTQHIKETLGGLGKTDPHPPNQARAMTAVMFAAIRAKACDPRPLGGVGNRKESDEVALRRGRFDIAIISTMRDALMRREEARELRWKDLEFREDGSGRLTIRKSKTDQEAKGFVAFLGPRAVKDLQAIMPAEAVPEHQVFRLTGHGIGRRIRAAARAVDLGDGFSGHSCRVGMAVDLARGGATIPEIMQVGRWKSAEMVARYIRAEEAASTAVARYYKHQAEE